MRKISLFFTLLGIVVGNLAVASPPASCGGSNFRGAWFAAIIPFGMELTASRNSADGSGAISAWLTTEDGMTEFFVFSPQWGGTPYEIFLEAQSREDMAIIQSDTLQVVQLQLTYEDMVGRFTITQSSDPISHLTYGYRTHDGSLDQEFVQKYMCFTSSIIQ